MVIFSGAFGFGLSVRVVPTWVDQPRESEYESLLGSIFFCFSVKRIFRRRFFFAGGLAAMGDPCHKFYSIASHEIISSC
tara:strand:+ start:250 stop:486 length:237 start_codon:yes stop_codon:yes gene_type:complete